ncbi:MAG: ankyrin repeat domain-containing protein [Chlamydiota bacterium]
MASRNSRRLTAAEVLHRYKDEDLPAFSGISLQDVNPVGNFGERPLHVAWFRGNIEEIAALIEAGAEINAPSELGNTPLHEAVGQGHLQAIHFLLDLGASPDAKNDSGETPLDWERQANRDDIVKLLQNQSGGHS